MHYSCFLSIIVRQHSAFVSKIAKTNGFFRYCISVWSINYTLFGCWILNKQLMAYHLQNFWENDTKNPQSFENILFNIEDIVCYRFTSTVLHSRSENHLNSFVFRCVILKFIFHAKNEAHVNDSLYMPMGYGFNFIFSRLVHFDVSPSKIYYFGCFPSVYSCYVHRISCAWPLFLILEFLSPMMLHISIAQKKKIVPSPVSFANFCNMYRKNPIIHENSFTFIRTQYPTRSSDLCFRVRTFLLPTSGLFPISSLLNLFKCSSFSASMLHIKNKTKNNTCRPLLEKTQFVVKVENKMK